jgi:DNA-binding NtrC family response regulator
MEAILVLHQNPEILGLLTTVLTGEGYTVETAASEGDALSACERRGFHLIVFDAGIPDGGAEMLRRFAARFPEIPILAVAAPGAAAEAMNLGAAGWIARPDSPGDLRRAVRRTLDQARIARERDLLREQERARFNCHTVIARDPKSLELLETVRQASLTDAPVLIAGESGAGKETLARAIHFNSPRAGRAFAPVNCAAPSPGIVENEIFGRDQPGRLERADSGTVFLDEIAELDPNLQLKLLGLLREKTFERAEGPRRISVDVRVIAATSRNLKSQVAEGRFRADLFQLLDACRIAALPLRERRQDISALAHYFLGRAARRLLKPEIVLTQSAENVLLLYDWPGNVRELANVMERVAMLCDRRVEARDLPIGERPAGEHPMLWKDIERRAIEEALRTNGGNRTRAARQLGISLRTLQYRLKEWGVNA